MPKRKNLALAPKPQTLNERRTQELEIAPMAVEEPPQAGTVFDVGKASPVHALKLTKAGHAELASGLATELRDAMERIARFRGFTNLADAMGSTLFVGEYKSKLDILATFAAEAERTDG